MNRTKNIEDIENLHMNLEYLYARYPKKLIDFLISRQLDLPKNLVIGE